MSQPEHGWCNGKSIYYKNEKTCFAHNFNAGYAQTDLVALVDRLIVMERGKILLDGPKAEVLQKLQEITAGRQQKSAA